MSEPNTIAEELGKYAIGAKLRRLRLRKSMGLQELSKHTGLSPALLSKLERDVMHPTLPTLLRIALVFSVGLDHFFTGDRDRPAVAVVRTKDRLTFPAEGDDGNVRGRELESCKHSALLPVQGEASRAA